MAHLACIDVGDKFPHESESIPSEYTIAYAYVTDYAYDRIYMLTVGDRGNLGLMTPAIIATGGHTPSSIVISPNRRFVYVTNADSKSISIFRILPSGSLEKNQAATISLGINPWRMCITPDGKYAYVIQTGGSAVYQFNVLDDGDFTAMSPATISAGLNTVKVVVSSDGKYAFALNRGNSTIRQFRIANGQLITQGTLSISPAAPLRDFILDKSNRFIYISTGFPSSVHSVRINADRSLTEVDIYGYPNHPTFQGDRIFSTGGMIYVTNAIASTGLSIPASEEGIFGDVVNETELFPGIWAIAELEKYQFTFFLPFAPPRILVRRKDSAGHLTPNPLSTFSFNDAGLEGNLSDIAIYDLR